MDYDAPEMRPIYAIAGGAGLLAATMGLEPTGFLVVDVLLTVVVAAAAVIGGAFAPSLLLVSIGICGAVLGSASPWGISAMVGALVGLWRFQRAESLTPDTLRIAGSASAAGSALGLLNMATVFVSGSSALIASIGFGSLAWHAWKHLDDRVRSLAPKAEAACVGFLALGLLTAGAAVLGGKSEAEMGVDAARAGLESARAGDLEKATSQLHQAESHFAAANDSFGAWWATPARAVPIVGHQLGALDTASDQGSKVAVAAIDALKASALDELRVDGAIDVDGLVALQNPLASSVGAVESAQSALADAHSPWLVGPIAAKLDELAAELDDVSGDLVIADEAINSVPALVGGDRPRRYLVVFATPSETREAGGIVGSVVEATFDNGRMTFSEPITNEALNEFASLEGLADPSRYPSRFVANEPEKWSQNWTGAVDFPTVAEAVRELYPQMGGNPIDGVIYVDPVAIEAIMRITGPISVPGVERKLAAGEIVDWLSRGQYAEFPDRAEREVFLGSVSKAALDKLLGVSIPDVGHLASTLAPAVEGGHLRLYTFHEEDQAFLDQLGITGAFDPPANGDVVAVVQANASEDKLDAFLHRDITYDALLDPQAKTVRANLRVELTNNVPADAPTYMLGGPDGLYLPGTNIVQLSVLTPHALDGASVDGEPTAAERNAEYGLERYTMFVAVPPGESRAIDFTLSGTMDRTDRYRVTWFTPPRIDRDTASMRIAVAGGGSAELRRPRGAEKIDDAVLVDTTGQQTYLFKID